MSWTLQGMWVIFCAFGVWTAILSETGITLGSLEVAGLCVFVIGLAIEMIADIQKAAFKNKVKRIIVQIIFHQDYGLTPGIPIILVKFWFG